jgi:hypothetical protein
MATKPLISITELLERSWGHVHTHANILMKRSSWFIALALASFALHGIAYALPDTVSPGLRLLDGIFVQLVGSTWVTMRLTQALLAQETGLAKIDTFSGKLLGSYLLVTILAGLATLGGSAILLFPGIWLGVALSFAQLILLESNVRGTQALAQSADLVKGRWWATFVRLAVPGFVILCLYFLVNNLLNSVASIIAGYNPADIVAEYAAQFWWSAPPKPVLFALGANQAISAIAMTLFAPLFISLTTQLYHELKRTNGRTS